MVSDLKKVTHTHKLLSLAKTTELDEFVKYFGQHEFVLMPKLDGITCALTYEHGVLKRAETRGDGTVGEGITHNAREFANIPLTIPYQGKLYAVSYTHLDVYKRQPTMVMIIITTTAFKKRRMYILGTIKKKTNSCSLLKVDDYEGTMNAD